MSLFVLYMVNFFDYKDTVKTKISLRKTHDVKTNKSLHELYNIKRGVVKMGKILLVVSDKGGVG
ncbi:hypothetical protein V7P28_17350, partial [Klebsiella michiganensis]